MTVRNGKRLVIFAGVLVLIVLGLDLWNIFGRGRAVKDWFDLLAPLLFFILLSTLWRSFSRLEAEHGPDYVQPVSAKGRTALIVLGGLAAVLAGVAAYLVSSR